VLDIESIDDPGQLRTVCRAYEASHRILVNRLSELGRRIAALEGVEAAQAALQLPDLHLGDPAVEPPPVLLQPPADKSRKPQRVHSRSRGCRSRSWNTASRSLPRARPAAKR